MFPERPYFDNCSGGKRLLISPIELHVGHCSLTKAYISVLKRLYTENTAVKRPRPA